MPTARSKTRPQRQKPLNPPISQAYLDQLLAELAGIRRILQNARQDERRRLARQERNERLNRMIDGGWNRP